MFEKEDCFRLGNVARLHGYKGEVSIFLDVDYPQDYKDLESVFIDCDGKLIPFFLEKIELNNKGFAVVRFEDVDTEKKAKHILKHAIYLPLDLLPELDQDEFYFHEIEGFKVFDENHGELGVVQRVIDLSGNPLIEINFNGNEILIPKQDEFIKEVDKDKKTILISAPEGLIEMYLGQ